MFCWPALSLPQLRVVFSHMKTLFKNARILTMEEGKPLFIGCLSVDETKIAYVGEETPKGSFDRVIDCQGNLLIPGFKNAHSHSAMVFMRSFADDLPLQAWLDTKVIPLEKKLEPGDEYWLSMLAFLEYLTSGITSCFDMYYSNDEMAEASKDAGFRTVILGTPRGTLPSVDAMKEEYSKLNSFDPLVSYQLGFHAEYSSSEDVLRRLSELSHYLKAPVSAHNSETAQEVLSCKSRHNGLSPTEYMDSLGLLDHGGCGFHFIHVNDHDISLFQKHGCSAVTCPGSNAKLADGIAPLEDIVTNKINLAIGTDGPASNNGLDFFHEMSLSILLQKLKTGRAEAFSPSLVLKAATVGGAKAMGLSNCLYLKTGQQADLVMIDLERPNMRPLINIPNNLVYSGAKDDVALTMVAGKILYEKGAFFLPLEASSIYEKAQSIVKRIIG